MTGSRNRPAQGPTSNDVGHKPKATIEDKPNKVRDEISVALDGFAHATPGNVRNDRLIDQMKLHQVLKHLMARKNESARSAAKSCGVPLSTFNSYLQPKKQVDPAHVIAIASHYGVTIDYLITGKRPPEEAFKNLPTKKIFSKWVKLTLEDLEEIESSESSETDGAKE